MVMANADAISIYKIVQKMENIYVYFMTQERVMAPKKKPPLPSAGDAFAFPVGDGRYSVCRVLLDAESEQSKAWKTSPILVACSAWIGAVVPRDDDPALRPILHPNHHAWRGKPNVLWISEQIPAEFIPIGTITPTLEEKNIPCSSFGTWRSVTIQPLLQWRWDNERETVLAEDADKAKEKAQARQRAQTERQNYLNRVTLEELRGHLFFPRWKSYPPTGAVDASRKIMADTVERLLRLGKQASQDARMSVLRECIESFNELDSEMRHFIETVEREDICEEFEAIVHASGMGSHEGMADQWREW